MPETPAKSDTPNILLDEPRPSALTVRYQPDNEEVWENPPRFAWLPTLDESSHYVLRISTREDYAGEATRSYTGIARNFFTPGNDFSPGRYWWSYAVWDSAKQAPASRWSQNRSFSIPEGLAPVPLRAGADRLRNASKAHPRLWLGPKEIADFSAALKSDPNHCHFARFLEHSVKPWINAEIRAEPAPYPGGKRTAEIWRRIYIECQEVVYAIRHLAIAGRLTGDARLLDRSRDWLVAVARWDVKGTTSRAYNDEAAFRIATALAWGYDWLHDHLTETERNLVRTSLVARTRDIAEHVIGHARIHIFPYDSHAVRFLSAVLIPCSIALLHEEEDAQGWLDYTVEYLFSIYSPWGGKDGGWAEGPHYWTLGLAYLLDAADLMKAYLGVDVLKRPFFQKTADFPIYTKAPGTRRVSFGDDSTMGDLPSLKVGSNVRRLAAAVGNPHGVAFYEELKRQDPGTERLFYNYGWWDFDFEDMVLAHDYPAPVAEPSADLPPLRVFHDVGWAAVQRHPEDPERHLQFVFKSSPYGSLSHSHGDQNAFLLRAFGEDLAIQSGHYVAFNSAMHRDWRRQTRSKNAILIAGKGQYAGSGKLRGKAASGQLLEAREDGGNILIRGDATAAYKSETPHVTEVVREIHIVGYRYFVIVDRVELGEAAPIQWLLHAERAIQISGETFRVSGARAGLYGQFVLSTSGKPRLTAVEGFPGVPDSEIQGLARHHHVAAETPAAHKHTLVTLLVPYPLARPARVLHFIDDQGYDARVYFVDEDGGEYSVLVPKDL